MKNYEVVQCECGAIKGVHKSSTLGYNYVSFQGIPYMKAPLGKLRFKEPQEPEKWEKVFDASGKAPSYVIMNQITNFCEGQEDAGIINVYTKNLKPEKLRAVMVYIHGGGFCTGSSKSELYSPEFILQKDVVLVTFNYRLGAIGFLSLDDESLGVPGNAGLKDQIFALKWIKKNIENFGGDPNNVTLMGESAGGASVHYLCLSPQSEGLFQRAVIMSGSAYCTQWAFMPQEFTKIFAEKLGRELGWKGQCGDQKDLLEFLEKVNARKIVKKTSTLVGAEECFLKGLKYAFVPVIESYKTENCVIPENIEELTKTTWTNGIDIFFSGTSFEGIIRGKFPKKVAAEYLKNPAYFLPLRELNLSADDPKAKELGLKIKNLYYDYDEEPSRGNFNKFLRYSCESVFWCGIYRALLARFKYSKAKTFLLRFHVDAKLNFYKFLQGCSHLQGASHADDVGYIFNNFLGIVPRHDSVEFKAIEKMVGIYTNFAIDGHPNCDEIKPVKFTPQNDGEELKCVQISEKEIKEIELPELEKLKIWESVCVEAKN